MTDHSILQALIAQAWQLAALAIAVAVCVRYVARNRPHLAHALWLVVLLKCVTPPVWGSPIGVFSWLSPTGETPTEAAVASESITIPSIDFNTLPLAADSSLGPAGVIVNARANHQATLESRLSSDLESVGAEDESLEASGAWLIHAGLWIWSAGVIAVTVISAIRFAACWRRLRRSQVEAHPELEALVARLSSSLQVRRAVRLLVTDSRIGPAVIGLLRPTILLPACVVRGRSAAELEPIVAHELIHIRRGDLWVGLLQTVAQALWWFHPLVWIAGRMITREAERCCDEEVIGELRCDPSRYARSLLGVLEWKRVLIPAPAVPGVRAVEITSRRLERIMTLGQGCRRRTPWWCWVTMLLVAAVVLPGSALQMTATEPDDAAHGAKATDKSADEKQSYPHPLAAPRADAAKPAPVTFPEERGGSFDHSPSQNDGKPLQVRGMGDLLDTIEKQLGVDRAQAKRVLWLRLVNAQREVDKPQPAQAIIEDAVNNAYERTDQPDGEPYWQGDTLVLSQYPPRRKRTEAAIAELRKFGFQSVEIEVRFVNGPLNAITDVSEAWTTLPMKSTSDAAAAFDSARALPTIAANSGVASFAIEKNLPVILDVLDDARTKRLIDNAQGDRRSNVLQAPRVRVENGVAAVVMDCSQTPFVVGFKEKQPQISVVSEGITVSARPILDGAKAHLDFEVVFSGIRNVEEFKVRGPDGVQTTIQSPEVAQCRIAAAVDAPLGQTVLIGGLKDICDPKSKKSMAVLLTVKKSPLDNPQPKQVSQAVEAARQTNSPTTQTAAENGPKFRPSLEMMVRATSNEAVDAAIDVAVDLTNHTAQPTAPLVLIDRFESGLTHASGAQPVEHAVAAIAPGETRRVTLALRAAEIGKWRNQVEVRSGGVVLATGESTIDVLDAKEFAEHKAREAAQRAELRAREAAQVKSRGDAIITMTYSVADLIIPFPNPVTITAEKGAKPAPQAVADFQPLLDLIRSTVAPESWQENGGECSVTPFPNNLSLVVSQTEKRHAEIAALLKQLRDKLDKQVVLDCRTVEDPAELFRLMKIDGKAARQAGLAMLPPAVVAQAHLAAEAKGGTNFKLTVFNGQQLKAPSLQESRDGKAGFVTLQAIIAPDKQTARLRIADSRDRVRQPWQQEEMTVLECGSLLIDVARFNLLPDLGVTPLDIKEGFVPKPAYVLITPRVIDAAEAKPPRK